MLGDDAQRNACRDYYDARGCDVDTARNPAEAEPLLRFRRYDLLVTELPALQPAREEIFSLLDHARRKAAVSVLLTTDDADADLADDDSTFVLVKPQPLDAILSLGRAHNSTRASF